MAQLVPTPVQLVLVLPLEQEADGLAQAAVVDRSRQAPGRRQDRMGMGTGTLAAARMAGSEEVGAWELQRLEVDLGAQAVPTLRQWAAQEQGGRTSEWLGTSAVVEAQ